MIKYKQKSKFVRDTIWTFLGSLIVGFAGLALQTIINGYLSSESLGIYAQVISFYTLFTTLCSMGLEMSVVKFISENLDNIRSCKQILSAALFLVIVSSSCVLLIIYLLFYWDITLLSSRSVEETFRYIIWAIPLFAINKMFIATYNACRKMKSYSFARSLRWILVIFFTLLFILFGKDLRYCALSYFYAELILFLFLVLIKFRKWIYFTNLKPWIFKHITYGTYGLFMSVIGEVNTNILIIISGYFLSLNEIAIIGFVMSFAKAIIIVATAVQLNFNPVFIRNNKLGLKSAIGNKIKKIYKITLPTSIPLLIVVVLSYHVYVTLFMGEIFAYSVKYFAVVALGAILTYISQWNSSMLLLSGKFKGEIFRVISVLILKLGATYVLTKNVGILGNLSAYTIVEIYSVAINVLLIKKLLGYDLLKLSFYGSK